MAIEHERAVVQFLGDYQKSWRNAFPALHRRSQWHIAKEFCLDGRKNGVPYSTLQGIGKTYYGLTEVAVRARLAAFLEHEFCEAQAPIGARTIIYAKTKLLAAYDQHLLSILNALYGASKVIDRTSARPRIAELADEQRRILVAALLDMGRCWVEALDRVFDENAQASKKLADELTPARRAIAKRKLMSTSHWSLVQMTVEHHYKAPNLEPAEGKLVDELAAALLMMYEQGLDASRRHVNELINIGVLERAKSADRKLRVLIPRLALSQMRRGYEHMALIFPAGVRGLEGTLPSGSPNVIRLPRNK